MRFVVVTGLSGAGKTQALRKLEDLGYFCVDNLPLKMLPEFAGYCNNPDNRIDQAAVVIDARSRESLDKIFEIIKGIKQKGYQFELLFLDAQDASLVRRFKATHRAHPIKHVTLVDGIAMERRLLQGIKEIAGHVVDTSNMSPNQLNRVMEEMFGDETFAEEDILIFISTFGFKRGIPLDADMVFDVRFLPNPYWVEELKPYSGKSEIIQKYIFDFPEAGTFLTKLYEMVEFLAPLNKRSGKDQLKIAIGCTGGMHRSVAVAEHLYARLVKDGYHVIINHRDMQKDGIAKG